MSNNENRYFKRYKRLSECKLVLNRTSYRANIVDYSINGFGLILQDKSSFDLRKVVELQCKAPFLDTMGVVMWKQKMGQYLRLGVKTPFRIKGFLKDYWLSDIFIGLQRNKKTGVLEVKRGDIAKNIYFHNGEIVFATSNQNKDQLGNILLHEEKITKQQYDQSIEAALQVKEKHGEILVTFGYLKPEELIHATQFQIEAIIYSLFKLTDGEFEFKEGKLSSDDALPQKLSTANLIYRGIKATTDEEYLKSMLPQTDTALCFSSHPLDLFQDIELAEDDKVILSYIDGKSTIEDVLFRSHQNNFEALKTLFALLSARIIDVQEEGKPYPNISSEDILDRSTFESAREIIEKIEDMYSRYKSLDYYKILDIPSFTNADEIKKAYYKQAKEFHPDRHLRLPADIKDKLQLIFSYINDAYTTLIDPNSKEQYDRSLVLKEPTNESPKERARKKFEEGRLAFWNDKYQKAERSFRYAVYADNQTGKYHYYHAKTLLKLKKYREAEKAISQAIRLEPSHADYLLEAGHIYHALGLINKAKNSFKKVLKLEPSNDKAQNGLVTLKKYRSKESTSNHLKTFNEVIKKAMDINIF